MGGRCCQSDSAGPRAAEYATNLAEAENCLAGATYDLILLDVMLPDGDGWDFLARNRAMPETPVIMLTARSQVCDRVGALDRGADDYITKPFDLSELKARCRAVLRRRIKPIGLRSETVRGAGFRLETFGHG